MNEGSSEVKVAAICDWSSTLSEMSLSLVIAVVVSYLVTVTVIVFDEFSCVELPANLTVKTAVPFPTALKSPAFDVKLITFSSLLS